MATNSSAGHSPIGTVVLQQLVGIAYGLSWELKRPVTVSKLSPQILVSRFCFLIKDPELLGEMASFRAGAERIEDEPGISCARMQENSQRKMQTCQKDTEASFKGLYPMNHIWTNLTLKLKGEKQVINY